MTPRTRVAICGSCLYMASLAAGLQANPTLDVVHIHPRSFAFPRNLTELAPAVIAYDPREMPDAVTASLLKERPNLLLISVDQATNEMYASSGPRATVLSANDFLRLIALAEKESTGRRNGRCK